MGEAKRRKENQSINRLEIVINKKIETMANRYPGIFTVKKFNDATNLIYYKSILIDECILLFTLTDKAESKQLGKLSVVVDNQRYHLFEVLDRRSLPLDQQAALPRFFQKPNTDIDAIFDYDGTGDNLYLPAMSEHGLIFLMFPAEEGQGNKVVWFVINGKKYFSSMLFAPVTTPFGEDEKECLLEILSDKGFQPLIG